MLLGGKYHEDPAEAAEVFWDIESYTLKEIISRSLPESFL